MINEKKYKIIDSVFFQDEIDYLLFRFTELNDSVDLFIVLEGKTDLKGNQRKSVFLKNREMFKKWENKIIHILSDYATEDELLKIIKKHSLPNINISDLSPRKKLRFNQVNDLISKIVSLDLNFEDLVLISEIDEFPEMPSISILQEYLSFEPVIFSQKNFLWSTDFVNEQNHLGTTCYLFSHFILSSRLIYTTSILKDNKTISNLTPINFGYRFLYFYPIEKSIKKIMQSTEILDKKKIKNEVLNSRNNLIYVDFENELKSNQLKKYKGILPKNIHMLDSQKIGRSVPKKHMVIIGVNSNSKIIEDGYETVSIITDTNFSLLQTSEKVKVFHIPIPNKKYYDILIDNNTLENFQKMYFLNEIKKILTSKFPIDIDIFEFHFEEKIVSLPWYKIENQFIYDLLHN